MTAENESLDEFLAMLRRHGVARYVAPSQFPSGGSGMSVEFFSLASASPLVFESGQRIQAEQPKMTELPEPPVVCVGCGHPNYDHRGDVGCIHGCDVRQCCPVPEPGPEIRGGAS